MSSQPSQFNNGSFADREIPMPSIDEEIFPVHQGSTKNQLSNAKKFDFNDYPEVIIDETDRDLDRTTL